MGFTPGISSGDKVPWLNPKLGKLFRMKHSAASSHGDDAFELYGSNIIEGFRGLGYYTLGTGAVAWFDQRALLVLFYRHLLMISGSVVTPGIFKPKSDGYSRR